MVSVSKSRRKKKNAGEKPKLRRRTNSNRQQAIVRVMMVVTVVSALLIVLTAGKMITRKDSMVAVVPNSGGQTTSTSSTSTSSTTISALPNNHQQIASSKSSSSAHKNKNVNGQHYSVVIVGAGIAGLTAAKTLETKNNDRILDTDDLVLLPGGVLILEATSQWGGRIRSSTKRSITNQRSKSDESHYYYPVDMGASFTTDPKWLPVILSKSGGDDDNDNNGGNTNKTKKGKIRSNAWDFTTTPVSEDWRNNISTSTTTAHDMMRNYSWYEFVQDFLLPSRRSGGDASSTESTTSSTSSSSTSSSTTKIEYNCIVDKIVAMKAASLEEEVERKNGNKKSIMQVSCGSMSVTADAVLVTIPLPLLQEPLDQQEKQREAMEGATDDADDDNDKIDGKPPPQDDIYNDDVDGDIFRKTGLQFHPPLPSNIQKRIHKHKATMLPALKIVFEFKHKFYPDYIDILKMPLLLAREDDDAPLIGSHEPKDLGVNPQRVYEYWADSEVRYDPKVRRPKGAKHYLVGQLLGQPAQAYYNFYYGPTRQNDFYRVSEFHDDMAQHLLQEFIDYMEQVEHFDEFLVRQNYIGYQIVHWTKETFTPGILDCSAVQFHSNHDKHGSKTKKKKKNFNQVGAVPHVNGQLYFAGEAFANLPGSWYHGCGQAHGAAISGKKAALQILHSLQTKKKKKKNDDNNNNNNNNNAAPEEKSDESSPSIMIPVPTENDSSTHRDLERFSILRPEDAEDLKFYAKMNELWKNFPN
ncbi:unnamed protein product [Cylindrotheca closterium]|uniref:Uncharacterized protein n=1 Tax=Cylindrotheca closterium TaxID=2856 RepID=A0AAD2PU37_9STRA|nr:unnamed protein product [Cylindrotheca closterium]